MGLMSKMFGSEAALRPVRKLADKIEALSDQYAGYSEEQLKGKTEEFKQRFENGETLDELLVEVFAQVREASWLSLIHI